MTLSAFQLIHETYAKSLSSLMERSGKSQTELVFSTLDKAIKNSKNISEFESIINDPEFNTLMMERLTTSMILDVQEGSELAKEFVKDKMQ